MKSSLSKMEVIWEEMQKWNLLEREFSCIMAPAPPDITDLVLGWGKMFITPDVLYKDPKDPDGFGMETEVHVTVKFGLHEGKPSEELLRIIEETPPFEIEIGPCTLFENEEFDVVKFDVDSEALRRLNARVSELPCTDTHPEYNPHLTVAYVTKGTCNELIGKPLTDPANESDFRFLVERVTFSSKDHTKTTLFLGRPNLSPQRTMEAQRSKLTIVENHTDLVAEILGETDLSHYTANKAPGTNQAVPWTKPDAEAWLESVRPQLEAVGYSSRIVGSVDRHGGSEKDLDVLLIPTGGKHNVTAAVRVLADNSKAWGRADEDLFNAVLPDGRIVEFWFEGLQDAMDEIDWDTREFKPEGTAFYSDEATQLPKGSLYYGKLGRPGANPVR